MLQNSLMWLETRNHAIELEQQFLLIKTHKSKYMASATFNNKLMVCAQYD